MEQYRYLTGIEDDTSPLSTPLADYSLSYKIEYFVRVGFSITDTGIIAGQFLNGQQLFYAILYRS